MLISSISDRLSRWWIRQLKGEQFKSIYLTDQYETFSNQKDVQGLSSGARLAEARQRAQAFVDYCEEVEKQNNQLENELLKRLQWEEMKTVFNFTQN